MRDFFKNQRTRLGAIRLACTGLNKTDFARELGLSKGTWSDLENDKKPLSLDLARQIKSRWHLPLDFILDGDLEMLDQAPARIVRRLQEIAAA